MANFNAVREAFESAAMEMLSAEISMIPTNTVRVDAETGRKLVKLMDVLDENDDVQKVHANFDLPDELLAELD